MKREKHTSFGVLLPFFPVAQRSSASCTGFSQGSAGVPVQLPWGSVLADCQNVRSMALAMGSFFFSFTALPPLPGVSPAELVFPVSNAL